MSIVHQQAEIGISSKQYSSVINAYRVRDRDVPVASITDLLLAVSASKEADYHDPMATSPTTNTQSSGFQSQVSSLSSQEMMPGPESLSFVGAAKSGNQAAGLGVRNVDSERKRTENTPDNMILQNPANPVARQRSVLERSSEPIHKLDTTAGQKRMANGEVKFGSSVSPVNRLDIPHMLDASPQRSPQRSPQIGHLTEKLRTRLTYAMVKVQHGWESKSINEVENLAAQQASLHATGRQNASSLSPQRKIATSPELSTHRMSSPNTFTLSKRSPDAMSTSSSASDTGSIRRPIVQNKSHKPTLAPPVDLGPRNPRRSNPPTFVLPTMVSNPNSNLSESSLASTRPQITTTPPIYDIGNAKLGSQKPSSAMEQDAIETLLFMSSPSNTQHKPSSQQHSASPNLENKNLPKKSKLSIPVNLAHVANTDTIPVSPRKKLMIEDIDLEDDQNIDQVLDQMPIDQGEEDTSSDEGTTA